jgi:fumarate hydratase class I
MTQKIGIGAQFGGKYFCHDVRVIRLPRHGARLLLICCSFFPSLLSYDLFHFSCPVGLGVSCSADRQVKAKITSEGIFIEQLETDVGKYLPEITEEDLSNSKKEAVQININKPMKDLRLEIF